jgi:rhodanese-related sulfurtransferase
MSKLSGRYGSIGYSYVLASAAVFIALVFTACSTVDSTVISAAQLHAMIQKHESFDLVDVRQPSEYNAGHISGAELIPLNDILNGDFNLNKNDTIVLYCRSGRRSGIALDYLEKHGYKHVEHLEGGIKTWKYGLVKRPDKNVTKGT